MFAAHITQENWVFEGMLGFNCMKSWQLDHCAAGAREQCTDIAPWAEGVARNIYTGYSQVEF